MIDICVVNYNTRAKLNRLLNNLFMHDNYIWNLFIEDNGSTDGSAEWLQEHASRYRLANVSYNGNIGYSAACNKAASRGAGDIIGLLNGDVWLSSKDVAAIEQRFAEHPEIAILGPKQRDEARRITHAGIFGTEEKPRHRDFRKHDPKDELHRNLEEAVTISGSAYFIRRSVWDDLTNCPTYRASHPDAVGAFLPTPHYYEETWCSYHARAHGYKVFYDGAISIGHTWHASSPVGGPADKMFSVSRRIFREACAAHEIPCD